MEIWMNYDRPEAWSPNNWAWTKSQTLRENWWKWLRLECTLGRHASGGPQLWLSLKKKGNWEVSVRASQWVSGHPPPEKKDEISWKELSKWRKRQLFLVEKYNKHLKKEPRLEQPWNDHCWQDSYCACCDVCSIRGNEALARAWWLPLDI